MYVGACVQLLIRYVLYVCNAAETPARAHAHGRPATYVYKYATLASRGSISPRLSQTLCILIPPHIATMPVTELSTKTEFDKALKDASEGTLVVIDFTAAWCGPCQVIKPRFAAMSEEFKDVVFYKVDVDKNDEAAENEDIQAMPTFKFYKAGKCIDKIVGGAEDKIRMKIIELSKK